MRFTDRPTGGFSVCCATLLGVFLVWSLQARSDEQSLLDQRELFVTAKAQLDAGDEAGFTENLSALQDYPLYDYLRAEYLLRQWSDREPTRADVGKLNEFEQQSGHESLTRRLTRRLQRRFAETEQWQLFLGISKSRVAATMPCTTLRARFEMGQVQGFDEDVLALWIEPEKPAAACADVIEQIERQNTPPLASIWERIFQSMEANKPQYAQSTLKYLSTADRRRVEDWIDAHSNPQKLLRSGELDRNTLLNRRILTDLVIDWSRKDTLAAIEYWLKVRDNYSFYRDRFYDTQRALVMRAAYRRMPEAQQLLADTQGRDDDLELAEWRVRTALLAEDWAAVLNTLQRLPAEEQEEDHWAYWQARAFEALGQSETARKLYSELAELQSYHGFLSADKIGVDYAIYDEPIDPSGELLRSLRADPALLRAREFNEVDLHHESRREWNNWMTGRESSELAAAAVLASEWNLHDRAIYAAGQSGEQHRRAISLRFPMLYRSEVALASSEFSIEPAWIFGVMRRESAYIRDVRSGAGAIGLMQLMPRTAEYVADLQGKKNWNGDLTDAGTNITFGTRYLRYVMDKFDNNQVMATAGYNAGPHRVDSWLLEKEIDADVWIDTIPFTETRRYVRAVMAYAAIYEYHLNGNPQRLSSKLKPVPAAPSA